MNDCITTKKQSTTKPCAYFLGYTVHTCTVLMYIALLRLYFQFLVHSRCSFTQTLKTLRPRQDGRHFADAIFTCIFFNENCCILNKFSLKYVRKGPIVNNPALVQIMAWRRSGDKPLSEPMMISLPTHICVSRPQWVKKTNKTWTMWTFLDVLQTDVFLSNGVAETLLSG